MKKLSFSDEAARLVQKEVPTTRIHYADTIEGVWEGIAGGDYGVVPVENSSKGPVWKHLNQLRDNSSEAICGEIELHVRMCLGVLPNTDLQDISYVHSHPMGIAQCGDALAELGLTDKNHVIEAVTADAPQHVAELKDPHRICLASRLAIEEWGLNVLREDMANQKGVGNITQFYLMHMNGGVDLPDIQKEHHAAIVIPEKDGIGILHNILGIIRNAGTDLRSLHSQKIDGGDGYRFFMEMDSCRDGTAFELMRRKLENCSAVRAMQWLGSWNHHIASPSIGMGNSAYERADRIVQGSELDTSRRYHCVEVIPDNYPGVLFDITGDIATSDVNLTSIHSRPIGPKTYAFLLEMDASKTSPSRMNILFNQLRYNSHIRNVVWICSTDSLKELQALEPVEP